MEVSPRTCSLHNKAQLSATLISARVLIVSTTPPCFDSADLHEAEPLPQRRVASLRGDHQTGGGPS